MQQNLTFQNHKINYHQSRSSYGDSSRISNDNRNDASPDSVILSNFSLFSSSASASVDRCSSASDVLDRDSFASDMSRHLSGRGFRPDPDRIIKKVEKEKGKGVIEYSDAEIDGDKNQTLNSARNSFSQALKDCQYRKSRSEILLRKSDRKRPTSLDLKNQVINVTSSSPRLIMKSSVSSKRTNMFLSPVTPNYRPSSERVPLHNNVNRRQMSSGLMSYNSGRTLPSKWEDAERWICSPAEGDGSLRRTGQQVQRRPKAKSGPLGPPGSAYNPVYSPAVHMFDGGHFGNLLAGSPFSSRVNHDALGIQYHDHHSSNGNFPSLNEPCMARSISVHGCSESLSQSLLRITQGES
ncbi:uncharacterized protein [Rutidosis leptorrhynchoides]|uniref:uncharacterized protein n=1 Tax=Rutidosis leptorrhynchoides TaxID=125765 RepID=UPI003A99678A